jgi:sugar transferase (PEP-CTERM system associated)
MAGVSTPFVLCALVEFLLFLASFFAAAAIRFAPQGGALFGHEPLWARALVSSVVMQVSFYYGELYENQGLRRRIELFLRLGQCFAGGVVALMVVGFMLPPLEVGRGLLALFLGVSFAAVLAWRLVFTWAFGREALCDRVLVLGTGHSARQIAEEMVERAPLGYRVVGFLTEHQVEVGRRLFNPSVLGTVDELHRLVGEHGATLIVVAQEDRRKRMPVGELLRCRLAGVRVREAADVYERMTGRLLLEDLRPSWLIFSQGFNKPRLLSNTKRIGEAVMAAGLLAITAPLLALIALAVRLDSRGPALYGQTRVGERGRTFALLKFRTMREDAEAITGPVWASGAWDPRVTRIGRFLRKVRLDELPQLLNVLRGEMSFVGPRPERPHFVEKLRAVIPYYDERHSVRPGITGWAQVRFPYGSTIEDAEQKLQYDLYYVKNMSLIMDLAIILETAKVALLGRGAR